MLEQLRANARAISCITLWLSLSSLLLVFPATLFVLVRRPPDHGLTLTLATDPHPTPTLTLALTPTLTLAPTPTLTLTPNQVRFQPLGPTPLSLSIVMAMCAAVVSIARSPSSAIAIQP